MVNRLLFLICLLVLMVILPASQTLASADTLITPTAATIDQALRDLVAAGTETAVSIIVQKQPGQTKDVEAYVAELGGQVTLDLPIINGFAAAVPGTAVDQLAQHPHVKHISLDAEISKSDAVIVERPKPDTVVTEPVETEQVDPHLGNKGDFSNPVVDKIVTAPEVEMVSQVQNAGQIAAQERVQRIQPAFPTGGRSAISAENQAPMMQTNGTSNMTGNVLGNPGFEDDFNRWENWGTNYTISTDARSGSKALRLGSGGSEADQYPVVREGETVTFSLWAKESGNPGWSGFGLHFYGSDGNSIGSSTATEITGTGYKQFSVTAVAPTGATGVAAWVWTDGYNGGYLFLDDTSVTISLPQTGVNLLKNSSFETGSASWYTNNATVVTTPTQSGSKAMQVSEPQGYASQYMAAVPGNNYSLSAYLRIANSPSTPQIGISFYDQNWNFIADSYYVTNSTTYTKASISIVAPDDAVWLEAWAVNYQSGSGKMYVDNASLVMSTPEQIKGAAPNLLDNEGFESYLTDWSTWDSVSISTNRRSGSRALVTSASGGGLSQRRLAVPGETYRMSGWVMVSGSVDRPSIGLTFRDANGNRVGTDYRVVRDTGYTYREITAVAPANAMWVYGWVENYNGGILYADDLSFSSSHRAHNVIPTDYLDVTGASTLHSRGIDGTGIGVAVVDTGVDASYIGKNNRAQYSAITGGTGDANGHGTFMAGIIGSQGTSSIAPAANIINVRVLDSEGKGTYSQVISGLNWILTYRNSYNIRVVNMSLMGPVTGPYWNNPLNQAVESLWNAGIVVVVAAGNTGPDAGSVTTPGNDPFVITVGSFTDNYTPGDSSDDYIPPFSGAGPTEAG
ncbi:MAG: S8 family serine peptidase, partial [Anaerolineales bacterium]|nr:S8 family serine peptidase [Anaerolineales bacterium]